MTIKIIHHLHDGEPPRVEVSVTAEGQVYCAVGSTEAEAAELALGSIAHAWNVVRHQFITMGLIVVKEPAPSGGPYR